MTGLDALTRRIFVARDTVEPHESKRNSWTDEKRVRMLGNDAFFKKECQAPKELELRVGAQVMLLKNETGHGDERLVNGSRGVVIGFDLLEDDDAHSEVGEENTQYPVVRFVLTDGRTREKIVHPESFEKNVYLNMTLTRRQVPLALAWAVTVHKSQGSSLSYVRVNLEGCFAAGQVYVAISRACSIDGLQIQSFNPRTVRTSPLVKEFYQTLGTGEHDAFLHRKGLWWGEVILEHRNRRWRSLFLRHPAFQSWAESLPNSEIFPVRPLRVSYR